MYLAYCLGNAYQIQSFLLSLNLHAYLAYRLDHALYQLFPLGYIRKKSIYLGLT